MSLIACAAVSVALSSCGGGGGGGPDVEPPVISAGPSATSLTNVSASIEWTTDRLCDGRVRYGKTTSYTDSVVVSDPKLNHAIPLAGLAQATTYHYRVASADEGGLKVTSSDRTFSTLSNAQQLVKEGWALFDGGLTSSALSKFEEAGSYEPHSVAVLEGLGWCYLKLYRLEESRAKFEEALSLSSARVDCLVGAALAYSALGLCDRVIPAVGSALSAAGDSYVFAHDSDVTSSDVRFCRLVCLAASGDFAGALSDAKVIDPTIDLDENDPSTWDPYSTFEEAMLAMIESLRSQV